jgi:tetratricopeptide (TPR) repeat protein
MLVYKEGESSYYETMEMEEWLASPVFNKQLEFVTIIQERLDTLADMLLIERPDENNTDDPTAFKSFEYSTWKEEAESVAWSTLLNEWCDGTSQTINIASDPASDTTAAATATAAGKKADPIHVRVLNALYEASERSAVTARHERTQPAVPKPPSEVLHGGTMMCAPQLRYFESTRLARLLHLEGRTALAEEHLLFALQDIIATTKNRLAVHLVAPLFALSSVYMESNRLSEARGVLSHCIETCEEELRGSMMQNRRRGGMEHDAFATQFYPIACMRYSELLRSQGNFDKARRIAFRGAMFCLDPEMKSIPMAVTIQGTVDTNQVPRINRASLHNLNLPLHNIDMLGNMLTGFVADCFELGDLKTAEHYANITLDLIPRTPEPLASDHDAEVMQEVYVEALKQFYSRRKDRLYKHLASRPKGKFGRKSYEKDLALAFRRTERAPPRPTSFPRGIRPWHAAAYHNIGMIYETNGRDTEAQQMKLRAASVSEQLGMAIDDSSGSPTTQSIATDI